MNDPLNLQIDDQWIRQQRGAKNSVDPYRPYHFLIEKERTLAGDVEDVITLFLTNKECRFSCLMCDLWKNTTDRTVPEGAVPAQIEWALDQLPDARHLKLYNSANFFDPGAIPPADYSRIAELVEPFESVIVENHPLLSVKRCLQFAQMIRPQLQVALGLETIHPEVLARLNKKMRPEDYRNAVKFLKSHGISSRTFLLLRPPFLSEAEGMDWAKKSMVYAFESGTDCCIVIPTRAETGAMKQLQQSGHFSPPTLQSLEEVQAFGIGLGAGMVFADSWDLEKFSDCTRCLEERKERMEQMNRIQKLIPSVHCSCEIHD